MKTTEEKIDYIYETLKKNERKAFFGSIFKWTFRAFILLYLYYFITVGLPNTVKSFMPNFPSFGGSQSEEVDVSSIDPSIIQKALDSYLNN